MKKLKAPALNAPSWCPGLRVYGSKLLRVGINYAVVGWPAMPPEAPVTSYAIVWREPNGRINHAICPTMEEAMNVLPQLPI